MAREPTPKRFKAAGMDQMEYAARAGADQQIRCVVSLDGHVDENRLERAISLTMDAEPVLGSRFVERPFHSLYERRDDLDSITFCSAVEVEDPDRELMDFLTAPIDPCRDPLVQVRVFRSRTDTVCVKMEHVAADTGGFKEYMYLLCSTYRRLIDDPEYVPEPNLKGERNIWQVLKRFRFIEILKALRTGTMPGLAWGFPWEKLDHSDRDFAVRRFPPEWFHALKEYGAGHQATVNDIILTAYFRTLFEMNDPEPGVPLPLNVPIDLRRYLPDGRAGAVCNCSGQLYPVITREPGEDFDSTLSRVSDVMNGFKENLPGVGSAIQIRMLLLFGFRIMKAGNDYLIKKWDAAGKGFLYLSNLGALSAEELDFGDVGISDSYLVSPIMYPPGALLGVSSFKDTMTFTLGHSGAGANRPVAERFLDLMERELAVTGLNTYHG